MELLQKICHEYDLGTPVAEPVALQGGLMHKMYSLFTEKGRYAVKLLNPRVMRREAAMSNFRAAEALELQLEQNGLPILPALRLRGRKMQELDGQYFYLYPWYAGKTLRENEVGAFHCRRMGELLARIHRLDWRDEPREYEALRIDWDSYLDPLAARDAELHALLLQNLELLSHCQAERNAAIRALPSAVAICHNDMDCKNVLWLGDECRVIDLECLSYSNPFLELYETALCWAGFERGRVDDSLLEALVRSYAEAGGRLPADWETIYHSAQGRLEWLAYNLDRALGVGCAAEEAALGASEAKKTLTQVRAYRGAREEILRCLRRAGGIGMPKEAEPICNKQGGIR